MPLQNRVTPTDDIIATHPRGAPMGNRGIIHDPDRRTLLKRRWAHQAWRLAAPARVVGVEAQPSAPGVLPSCSRAESR